MQRAAPTSEPMSSVWKTPSGEPARRNRSSSASAHCGTFEACLSSADVAGHQRRRGEADHLPEREVPGHHRQHRAERLIADRVARRAAGAVDDRPAAGIARRARRSSGSRWRTWPPRPRRAEQLAHLQRHQPAEGLALAVEDRGCARHDPARSPSGTPAPVPEGRRCACQLRLDRGRALRLESPQPLTCRRIDALDSHRSNVMQPRRSGRMGPQPWSDAISRRCRGRPRTPPPRARTTARSPSRPASAAWGAAPPRERAQ